MSMKTEKLMNSRCVYDNCIKDPKQALRSFAVFVSKIDWSQSESLRNLFAPFNRLGKADDYKGNTV